MTDFSDERFAVGSLTGLRTFRIDRLGRLLASQFNIVWTPDENRAVCHRNSQTRQSTYAWLLLQTYTMTGTGTATASEAPQAQELRPDESHRAGKLDCTCGFYAYFDNQANTYHQAGNIYALVEGYGLTAVGDRGFRSEKARVQALVIPAKAASVRTDRVRQNYPDIPVFAKRKLALAEFPLTRPPQPTPTLDLDFWTREVSA